MSHILKKLCYLLAIGSLLAACEGWQLRGAQSDAGLMPRVHIVSEDDAYSPMARSLREAIERRNADVAADALYILHIMEEVVDRRPVTYTPTGTPAQYEMTLTLTYAIGVPGQEEISLPLRATAHRLYDFDPRNVVAKAEEERVLLEQMRQQVAQRLLSEVSRRFNSREMYQNEPEAN